MNALASLDGISRAYRYRKPLGSLACACSENGDGDPGSKVTTYTTDLALSNQGLANMKVALNQNSIPYTEIGDTLSVNTSKGVVSIPAFVDSEKVDEIIAYLKAMSTSAGNDLPISLVPGDDKWKKWLLILGGSWLAYELFIREDKSVVVNVGKKAVEGLGRVKQYSTKKNSRKPERKTLPVLSI